MNNPSESDVTPLASNGTGGEGVMCMPRSLTAESVESVAAEMLAVRLDKKRHVTLDFSQVGILTSPGVQLIVALEKALMESSGTLVISEVKSAVAEVFSDLGFERLLRSVS